MSGAQEERPMTVIPVHVTMLREIVAEWEQAHAAWDDGGTRAAGAQLVGAVEALLRDHDRSGETS